MKKTIEKGKYIIDHVVELVICVLVGIGVGWLTFSKPLVMVTMEIVVIGLVWGLSKTILILPLDLLQGPVEQDVYFSKMYNISGYEFFKEKCYCEWNFYFGATGALTLVVPVCMAYEDILQMDRPETDQKIKVRYYKYSKILCSWEPL